MFSLKVDENLRLELPEPHHAETVYQLVRDNMSRLQRWMPWAVDDYSVKHANEWIQRKVDSLKTDGSFNALIILDNNIVGTIGFHDLDTTNKHAAIGYWIDVRHEGKGIVTRCTRALIENLFSEMGLNRIQINCNLENRRSRAVPERLGFTLEGIQREVEFLKGQFS